MTGMTERRRWPRAELHREEAVRLELRQRVQLLDISQSGALIGSDISFPVHTRGHFRTGLGGLPFSAEIVVKRHHPRPLPRSRAGLGAQFDSVDERNMRNLEQFLGRGRSGGS